MTHILVTYATWTGATHQVAEVVADELRKSGATADVKDAGEVKRLEGYDAVVMGTSAHVGKVPRDAVNFARRHAKALATVPVAQFIVCLTMSDPKPENCETARGYLAQIDGVIPQVKIVDSGLFGGAVLHDTAEFRKLNPLLRGMAGSLKDTKDTRDWDAIRAWAAALPAKLGVPVRP